ncbi:MAG: GNAT family N-acetyltransferase [Phycisphaerales bacterium]|jgi:GNAT superfamily N-acetyltransferase|nr:GNAT family N-acetyltransferase [Phycisphaerales bacterium]
MTLKTGTPRSGGDSGVVIRSVEPQDRDMLRGILDERWGSSTIISRGVAHDALDLPAFTADLGDYVLGLVTYTIEDGQCQIVTLDSVDEKRGVGSALVGAVVAEARKHACSRVWLVTSNDNTPAMRFYQKRGFRFTAVHRGWIDFARERKPQIPLTGADGIPLRDEIELELTLEVG